jgi:hypothetical protein
MKKNVLIEKVLLSVSGGHPTDETLTMRPDIEVYLDLAIQEYIATEAERQDTMALRMARVNGIPVASSSFSSAFIKAFELDIIDDYVMLPSFYKTKGGGIESARYNIQTPIQIIFSPKELDGISEIMAVPLGYHEKIGSEERLYLINKPESCEKVTVRLVASFSALNDDDDVPLPSQFAATIIDRSVAHFKGDKWLADYYDDEIDAPNAAPQQTRRQ